MKHVSQHLCNLTKVAYRSANWRNSIEFVQKLHSYAKRPHETERIQKLYSAKGSLKVHSGKIVCKSYKKENVKGLDRVKTRLRFKKYTGSKPLELDYVYVNDNQEETSWNAKISLLKE